MKNRFKLHRLKGFTKMKNRAGKHEYFAMFISDDNTEWLDCVPRSDMTQAEWDALIVSHTTLKNGRLTLREAQRTAALMLENGQGVNVTNGYGDGLWTIYARGYLEGATHVLRWMLFCIPELELSINRDDVLIIRTDNERLEIEIVTIGDPCGKTFLLTGSLCELYGHALMEWWNGKVYPEYEARWMAGVFAAGSDPDARPDKVAAFETQGERAAWVAGLTAAEEIGDVTHVKYWRARIDD